MVVSMILLAAAVAGCDRDDAPLLGCAEKADTERHHRPGVVALQIKSSSFSGRQAVRMKTFHENQCIRVSFQKNAAQIFDALRGDDFGAFIEFENLH